jgi:hypothetical protein
MWRRVILGILIVAVLAAGAIGIGVTAYNYGVARGLTDSGQVVVGEGRGVRPDGFWPPMHFGYARPMMGARFGYGFGFLGCLGPLLFLFLVFALFRFIFWRPWGWGWRQPGPWGHGEGKGLPPMFEEWHKRAHGEQPAPPESPQQS